MKSIVIFASGKGSNADNIISYFLKESKARVVAIFTNNAQSGAVDVAKKNHLPLVIFPKNELESDVIINKLEIFHPDLIILAGFLLKMPYSVISHFAGKIVNLHPSLLPKYGGKGMYGSHVHQAVLANKESETGITIHWVNENYDQGAIIAQYKIPISSSDGVLEVTQKVMQLEQAYFPQVISTLL
jgi:phosphoribosylglycinamide formyltransferase-1